MRITIRKLLLSILLFLPLAAYASPVSESTALLVGRNFMASLRYADADSLQLVYAVPLARHQHPACYVFACPAGGFVIVAADDVATPVWGYSTESVFQPQDVPCNVLSLLGSLAGQLDAALTGDVPSDESTLAEWQALLSVPAPLTAVKTVGPLLSSKWNQTTPYNAQCPKDSKALSDYGGRVPCGCVATAMAQLIRYHKYPTAPRGWHQYTSDYGNLTADFDNTTFSYTAANMPNSLSSSSSTAAKNMVSTLIYRCGVAVDMKYKPSGSAANFRTVMAALASHFRFDASTIGCASRDSKYTVSQWESMLKKELDAKRPMLYDGRPVKGEMGHAFVCDGYKSDGTFHFNFGWGGPFNGYFKVTALTFKDYGNKLHDYSVDQSVVLGIKPAAASRTLLMHASGESRYTVSDTLMLYNMHALNSYGYDSKYNAPGSRYATFLPADPNGQLVVEVIGADSKSVSLYDGTLAGGKIYMAKKDGAVLHTPDSQMITTQHRLTVTDSGNYAAYALRIFVDQGLRQVQRLRVEVMDDSLQLRWSEVGNAAHWQLEYGPQGFAHGSGTMLNVDDTILMLPALPYDTTYDFFVRSRIDTRYGAWSMRKSFTQPRPEWTSVVTSQPDGFLYDADSNITISTPQGMAWLISVVNGLNGQSPHTLQGRTVRLVSSFSMSPYAWTPLKDFAGTFEGNGYTLTEVRIADNKSVSGFFATISDLNARIQNLHLEDIVVHAKEGGSLVGEMKGHIDGCSAAGIVSGTAKRCGGLVGAMYGGSIRNSMASVKVSGLSKVGGLVGTVSCGMPWDSVRIENSYAVGKVSGKYYVGGLVGVVEGSGRTVMSNCYTAKRPSYDSTNTFLPSGMMVGKLGKKGCVEHCYAPLSTLRMIGDSTGAAVADTASFASGSGGLELLHPVYVDGDTATLLRQALDAWVSQHADSTYRTWVDDTLPRLGECYAATCGKVDSIVALGTGYDQVLLQWQGGAGARWRMEYMPVGTPRGQGTFAEVDTPQVALAGLQPGVLYDVYLRTVCQDGKRSPWSHHSFRVCDATVHHVAVSACDRYVWLGDTLTHSSLRQDTLAAQSGCDSAVSLALTINHSTATTDSVSVCDDYWGPEGHLTESGLYTTDTVNASGCDSLHTLVLAVHRSSLTADTLAVCDSLLWHGSVYTDSVADCVFDTLNAHGCDSTVRLHLTVHGSTRSLATVQACDSLRWHGTLFQASTDSARFDTVNPFGCRHTELLDLTIHHSSVSVEHVDACDHYYWPAGHTDLSVGGTYADSAVDAHSCDSISLLVLTLHSGSHSVDSVVACDSAVWHGSVYTSSSDGIAFDTVDAHGCDSTVTLVLVVNPSSSHTEALVACDSLRWHGATYTAPVADATFDTVNASGCPHVEHMSLALHHTSFRHDTVEACDRYFWPPLAQWLDSGGHYRADTLTGAGGCDSIRTLLLAIHHGSHSVDKVEACDSAVWHGTVYTSSSDGIVFDTVDAHGCDSTVTLMLTVRYSTSHAETFVACDSLRWHGTTYTAPVDDAVFDTVNYFACPHVEHMSLVLYYTTFRHDTVDACDEYYWPPMHQWLETDGYYTDTLMGTGGCDSICSLLLAVHSASHSVDSVVACDSLLWHGAVYYNDYGDPTFDTLNRYGCDSTVSLALTILHSRKFTRTVTTAAGEYEWRGTVYTESGTYTDTLTTVEGCDSVLVLVLNFNGNGVDDVAAPAVAVWPNPTRDVLHVEAEGLLSVEVYDAAGRRVLWSDDPAVVMQPLPAGTYMVVVHTATGTAHAKVVKR